MRCSKCGSDNREGRKFCRSCGSKLGTVCPKCSADNEADEDFCGDCGAALSATNTASATRASGRAPDIPLAAGRTEPPTTVDGERKTVTALFADIKGSMELMEDLDPEEARAIVDPALKLMIEAIRRYGGYVVQSTGDGIFALFGAPLAHEDHPQRALYAALRMQEDLKRYSDRLRVEGKLPLQARVGVTRARWW
jgi:class 3 adenylate cyclase